MGAWGTISITVLMKIMVISMWLVNYTFDFCLEQLLDAALTFAEPDRFLF